MTRPLRDRYSASMTRPLRAGVIGLGVGERHVVGYLEQAACEVVAVCDLDGSHAQAVARRYGVPLWSTDFRRVTEHPDIDVVSICSFDDAHVEQAISALRNGKHVMVEKPVALRREDAARLLEEQQRSGLTLTSNLILRASPRFQEVHRLAREGAFGDIFYLEGDYLHDILWKLTEGWRGRIPGYSVIHGGGIHLIDLMRWIVGAEVAEVSGMGGRVQVRESLFRGHDTTVTLLGFDGGAVGKCTTMLGPRRPKFHSLKVFGTAATFENGFPDAAIYPSDRLEEARVVTTPYPGMGKGDLLEDFVTAVRHGRPPLVAPVDVFRVMDVCFTAVEAIDKGCTLPVQYSI